LRVAVVGGGVFGCTIAVDLARAGAAVDLFEARHDILDGATGRCQARLHSGFHYPRCDVTAAAARDGAVEFAARYRRAVERVRRHFYVVADGGKTTPDEYLAFCDRLGLPYEVADPPGQVHTSGLCVRVPERLIDVPVLRRQIRGDLARAGVSVRLGQPVELERLAGYDTIVNATYGRWWPAPLRFEVCEVALVELGRYQGDSIVVLDGEFVSLDPVGRLYALYDVRHSVHACNVGMAAEVPDVYRPLLGRQVVRTPLSNVEAMLESAGRFLWGLDPGGQGVSIWHGSLWSVRAVLPGVDATDERPTLIERDGNVVHVLSGKICTAVSAARQVTQAVLGLVPA
jgi:FAD dependent oxidoreductase